MNNQRPPSRSSRGRTIEPEVLPSSGETEVPGRRDVRTTIRDAQRQRAEAPRADPKQDTTQLLKPARSPATRAARTLADAGSTGIRGRSGPTTAAADPRPAERSPRTGARRGPTST